MINDQPKSYYLIITLLIITPFIIFLGKNFSQFEFFSIKFFLVTFFYCFLLICTFKLMIIFSKKSLVFVLFFSYFSFLQFYFFDIRKLIWIFQYGNTGYYILLSILLISFVAALISRFLIFKNFILILLFLNLSISLINIIPNLGRALDLVLKSSDIDENSLDISISTQKKYPNIFYIIPDGLASPKVLKDYANIEFQYSIQNFEEKGFAVPQHNHSSYNLTYLSLAALFGMDYPVTQNSIHYKDRSSFYPTMRDYNPLLLNYLNKNNYKFIIVPPSWGGCPDSKEYKCLKPITDNFLSYLFQDYAISKMFQHSLIKRIFDRYNNKKNISKSDMNDAGKTLLSRMQLDSKYWKDGGVFTMVHMMIPHQPYREEDCSRSERFLSFSKEGYRSSVFCAFNRIHEMTEYIVKNYPDASIVIQSDHGVSTKELPLDRKFVEISASEIENRLSYYTAVKGCNSNEAAKLNQAHIIEYIVECLTNRKSTKQHENKSFFGFYELAPEFGKVFRVY